MSSGLSSTKRKKESDKKAKYVSIIPKEKTGLNPYQIFTKEMFAKYAAENDTSIASERIKKMSEVWKTLTAEELDAYKERSEESKRQAHKEWIKGEAVREEARRKWCAKLGIDKASPWDTVDGTNRAVWDRKHAPVAKKQSTKSPAATVSSSTVTSSTGSSKGNSADSDNDDDEMDDGDADVMAAHEEYVSTKMKNKKRRIATEQALVKIKEQGTGLSDDSSSDSDDSTSLHASSNKRNKQQVSKKGASAGLLAASGMMGAGSAAGGGGEGKALRKRSSRVGDVEWSKATWGEERAKAVTKAIDRVYEMALDPDNFDLFGNDMIQCFYDVSTVTGEPIRSKALKYVEHLANRWKYTIMQEGWKQDNLPTPSEVMEVVTGMYCMERVGIRHDLKAEVLQFLESESAYCARDYFGWDPRTEALSDKGGIEVTSDAHVSKYRLMSTSLIQSFYADRVGLALGCQYSEIFRWLPVLRPYKGPHQLPWQEYIDQCYLITHIILTTNNWGELGLNPALFPHEYFFLRSHLEIHVQQRDVHLIAEFVESLRCFGCGDEDPLIRKGMRALIALQAESGIWDFTEDDAYRTYHATMCGAQALLAHRFRGFGPGIPSVVPILLQWEEEEDNKRQEYLELTKDASSYVASIAARVKNQRDAEFGPLLTMPMGGINRPTDMSSHLDERLNALKVAIRQCAKISASIDATISKPSSPRATNGGLLDANYSAIMESLKRNLKNYLGSLKVEYEGGEGKVPSSCTSSMSSEELSLLADEIERAVGVPVTADILQSAAYKPLTKIIRNARGKSDGKDGITEIQQKCMELMNIWKEKVLTAGTASITAAATTVSADEITPKLAPTVSVESTEGRDDADRSSATDAMEEEI